MTGWGWILIAIAIAVIGAGAEEKWKNRRRGVSSTLEHLFAPGQRIPELDDADLNELADLVLEELARRKGLDVKLVGRTRHAGADPTPVLALEWEDI